MINKYMLPGGLLSHFFHHFFKENKPVSGITFLFLAVTCQRYLAKSDVQNCLYNKLFLI